MEKLDIRDNSLYKMHNTFSFTQSQTEKTFAPNCINNDFFSIIHNTYICMCKYMKLAVSMILGVLLREDTQKNKCLRTPCFTRKKNIIFTIEKN